MALQTKQFTDEFLAFIDGEYVTSIEGATMEDIDPSTGEAFARVASCGPADAEAAIAAAQRGFARWRRAPVYERLTVLARLSELILEHQDELAQLESLDVGKPLTQALSDVRLSARYFEFFSGVADKIYGESIPVDDDSFGITFREPLGVTVHITPWNYPLLIASRSLAPALAAGNACVIKPAEETPLSTVRLGALAAEAGVPQGVLNVLPGFGETVGAALVGSPDIDHVSFTGSPEVGTIIMKSAADNWTPVSLELGGKSPNIVFADGDVDQAVPIILKVIIQNAGQTCSAATRLLVETPLHEQILERLATPLQNVTLGRGLDDPDMGPVISGAQRERVVGFIERARDAGGVVVAGGGAADGPGYFVQPTLVDQVDEGMEIAREEVFGPVLAVMPFDGFDQAVSLANGTPYGLAAGVWTRDVDKALRAVRSLDCGQVYVNTYALAQDVALPFGGYKKSGFGREKGLEAVLEYTQVKAAAFRFAGGNGSG